MAKSASPVSLARVTAMAVAVGVSVLAGRTGQAAGADGSGAAPASAASLLDALAVASNEEAASALEARITRMWLEQASPAVGLLIARGLRDLDAGAHEEAVQDFADAIALDPANAEAWHQRAVAQWRRGALGAAIADLEQAIRREPRQFRAWRTLSLVAEERKDWRGAYAAWQKVLEIDPRTKGGAERLRDLKRRALGDPA